MFGSRSKMVCATLFGSKTTSLNQSVHSNRIKEIAERGSTYPQLIDVAEVHELCGALMAHYGQELDLESEHCSTNPPVG